MSGVRAASRMGTCFLPPFYDMQGDRMGGPSGGFGTKPGGKIGD
jgi:hypothetical protein